MNIQSETVRRYVLAHLEDGSFSPEKRLPGFRKIADELKISCPVVQNSLDKLVNEGILLAKPRSGLYVEPNWRFRRIRGTLHIYKSEKPLPWLETFRTELCGQLPQLHISTQFLHGPLEIITTADAQSRHEEFIDLMPILKECYPDMTAFFEEQLKPFTSGERLTALPFVFSPRIIACNRKMLAEAHCDLPSVNWEIADLLKLLGQLSVHYSWEQIFNSYAIRNFWINFVLSCGGELFDSENAGYVKFDSREALEGFRAAKALRPVRRQTKMRQQDCAVMIIDRQTYRRIQDQMDDGWVFLPIPGNTPERTGISIQATELFAVRHGSLDQALISPIIRFLWSEKFQDHLAELKYGIPIRRSSADKSFSPETEPDRLFRRCCRLLRNDYQLHDPDLLTLISNGIDQILSADSPLEKDIADFAYVVRQYIKYRGIAS